MTTTAATWVDRTRAHLLGGTVAPRNKLAADYTAGSGSLTFTYPIDGITAGARLSIGLNTFYVWDVNVSTKTVTVSGGQEGTTDANAASGSVAWVRPRFTDYEVFTALNEEIAGLSSQLPYYAVIDLTWNPAVDGYDLGAVDARFIDVYEVRYQTAGPEKTWPRIPSHLWRLDNKPSNLDFISGTSGVALKIFSDAPTPGLDVRVIFRTQYTVLTDLTFSTVTVGIPDSAADIPPLGAAIRCMAGREIKRNFTESQPDTRRATEVPPGAIQASVTGLRVLYQQRLMQEVARLAARYPAIFD